jgi:endonuclease/exonuclease/phosphatase family metal-dependent hydrolase
MMSRIPLGVFHSYGFANTPIPGQTNEEGNPASQTFINNRMWTADLLVNADYQFTLSGAHLKAGRGPRNEAWRRGQIQLLRANLSQLMRSDPDKNMLVMGDLNMTPKTDEFSLLLGDRPPYFSDPLKGTGSFSHPSDSLFWRIDHILPNRQMQGELVPGSTRVARPLPMDQMIQLSDHLPIISTFLPQDQ